MKNKKSILAIRKRIPVGITTAKKLLEQSNFDILEAEKKWKTNQVVILAEKISVAKENAEELLEFVKYDFAKALSVYRDQNTTDVEKILQSSKKEEQVLANFWFYISEYLGDDVKYGGWLNEKGFAQLPELIREILTVWQWYAFYDFEGISVEQKTSTEVIHLLDTKLGLKNFAQDLTSLKEMVDLFNLENPYDEHNFGKRLELTNKFTATEAYKKLEEQIDLNEELVMKKTYQYLYENSEEIDKLIKNELRK